MKDRTWIMMIEFKSDWSAGLIQNGVHIPIYLLKETCEEILYDDVKKYEDLPAPCKCEETKKEFEEWKEYRNGLDKLNKLERQIDRFRR